MTWQTITANEYRNLFAEAEDRVGIGETLSDPDGSWGLPPQMLTTWIWRSGEKPYIRHQCWPIGHALGFSRPCQYDRWVDGELFIVPP